MFNYLLNQLKIRKDFILFYAVTKHFVGKFSALINLQIC